MSGFAAVFDRAVALTATLDHPGMNDIGRRAAALGRQVRFRPANDCPLSTGASDLALAGQPPNDDLLTAVEAGFDDLTWFRSDVVPVDFVAHSAAAELVGPDGAVHGDEFRFGLFFIRPDAFYQRHWHAAEETYFVLAGRAEWNLDDGWFERGPGSAVDVPSMTPHAIRTGPAGVTILYSWIGDITFDSYRAPEQND